MAMFERGPFPLKETLDDKKARVKFERLSADRFLKHRMETIAEIYRIPLRELHEKNVIQRSIPNVEQLRKIIRKERMHVDTVHTLCVDNSGQVKTNSELLGQRKPQTFYRSTRLAAWRVYRHHQPPDDIMKLVAKSAAADKKARRKLTFAMRRPSTIPRGLSFSEYSKCCNQAMINTRGLEKRMSTTPWHERKSRCSFFIVNPYTPTKEMQGMNVIEGEKKIDEVPESSDDRVGTP